MQTCNLQYKRLSIVSSIPNNAYPPVLKYLSYIVLLNVSQCTHEQVPKPNRLLCGHIITIFILERIVHIISGSALNKNNKMNK